MTSRRLSYRTLASLAVGALVVRLAYLVAFAGSYRPRSDADHYQAIAANFAHGDGLSASFPFTYQHPTAFRPPLYPALLGAFYRVTGVHVGAGQLLDVALGVVVVVLAALLGAQIAGRRGGLAAGIAVGVYPPLIANDVVILSEPLSLVLLLGMILLLSRGHAAWAGLACGFLVLTRPSAQLLVVAIAAWLVWRAGWRSAARFGAVTVVVVTPWVVRNWMLVGEPVVVSSNGFNLVSAYSEEAQQTKGFADAVFDERFTRINLDNRSEVDLDEAYREHAIDAVRDDRVIPLRVLRHNFARYFELRPGANVSAERDDGRNITVRDVTLPLVYAVTVSGVVGLWRARRRRGAELLLLEAAYFTVASIVIIAVPRLRAPLDLAAAIGVGLLVAQLLPRQGPDDAPDESGPTPPRHAAWSRRTKVLAAVAVIAGLVVAARGVAFARNRVEDNAESQLRRALARDEPAVERLARLDAATLAAGSTAASRADFDDAQALADRLWLLSPRLSGTLRNEGRAAARTLDEGLLDVHVLALVTAGDRDLTSARATYETRLRPADDRLPGWDALAANTGMRRAGRDIEGLERALGRA